MQDTCGVADEMGLNFFTTEKNKGEPYALCYLRSEYQSKTNKNVHSWHIPTFPINKNL